MKGGEKMRDYKIYLLTFPNGKQYVGMTKQRLESRWKNGHGYDFNKEMDDDIKRFGWDNIKKDVLETGLTEQEAFEAETYYIKEMKTREFGYNKGEGGKISCPNRVIVEYNGQKCTSLDLEAMAQDGITHHDITTRLSRGWDIDRAITQKKHEKVFEYEYNGAMYTIDELYKMCKVEIDRPAFVNRLRSGWTIERALTWEQGRKLQPYINTYEYNGDFYNIGELIQISNVEGLTDVILRDRINNKHWSIEKAITQPLKKQNQLFEYNGELYNSKQLANLSPYKMTHHHVMDRIRAGWSIEKTINTPINKK